MTILGARDFDRGATMLNDADLSASGIDTASTAFAKTGAYSLRLVQAGGFFARWALSGTPDTPAVSLWIRHATSTEYNSSNLYLRFLLGTGEYIDLRWNGATHTFDAYVDDVLVAAGSFEVSNVDWFHVQFYVTIADAGYIGCIIDGHSSIAWNGDTQPGAATGATHFYFRYAATGTMYIDDLVYGYDGPLGVLYCYPKVPTGDSSVAWTPSTGADNYAMEDETPPNDADYNASSIDGQIDKFGLSALDVTDYDISGIVAWVRAKTTGAPDSIKVGIDSGGTVDTQESALSASFEYYFGNFNETDPATLNPWDQAALDAVLHYKESVIV